MEWWPRFKAVARPKCAFGESGSQQTQKLQHWPHQNCSICKAPHNRTVAAARCHCRTHTRAHPHTHTHARTRTLTHARTHTHMHAHIFFCQNMDMAQTWMLVQTRMWPTVLERWSGQDSTPETHALSSLVGSNNRFPQPKRGQNQTCVGPLVSSFRYSVLLFVSFIFFHFSIFPFFHCVSFSVFFCFQFHFSNFKSFFFSLIVVLFFALFSFFSFSFSFSCVSKTSFSSFAFFHFR